MAIKFQLRYLNIDSTSDINERLVKFIDPGIVYGGEFSLVPSQLQVTLSPWKIFNSKGMIVEETSDIAIIDVIAGQSNVIAIKAIYNQQSPPTATLEIIEKGVFDTIADREDYIVFGSIDVPLSATEILQSYINLSSRQEINPLSRNNYRGTITSVSFLPERNNRIGDLYGVCDGIGGALNLFGWDGLKWVVLTDILALQVEVSRHRQNLFDDENHLTDLEKLAAVGSYGIPSSENVFVTDQDPRVPTQEENDALVGSAGEVGSTNRYMTEATEFAQPVIAEYKVLAPTNIFPLQPIQGPVYLGRNGSNTHLQYFEVYDESRDREYLNSDSSAPTLIGVYKDAALTQKIVDPSSEAISVISSTGFYISPSPLYLQFDINIDTNFRLLYGKKTTFGTYKKDMLFDIKPKDAQINRNTILKFEELSGRKFDQITPSNETNKAITEEVGDIKKYINSNLNTDFVVTDFAKMDSISSYSGGFEENVGLISYKYANSSIVQYTYNYENGQVTYSSYIDLSQVLPGHVFIDSNLKEFVIDSVIGSNALVLNGSPKNVGTSATKEAHGSIKVNDNPRRINLSDFKVSQFRDRIAVSKVTTVQNEHYNNAVAYEIADPIRTNTRKEDRFRLYGNIQQRSLENFLTGPNSGPKNQVFASDYCVISITGFFTDLEFVGSIPDSFLSNLTVLLDGFDYPLSLVPDSKLGSTYEDNRLVNYPIITNAADNVPHTAILTFNITSTDDELIIGGVDLIRRNYNTALVSSGRCFVQGDLVSSDNTQILPLSQLLPLSRGGISNIYYNRNLEIQNSFTERTEFDGLSNAASGSSVVGSLTMLITSGASKLAYFSSGDIVKVITSTNEETKIIDSIENNLITFSSSLNISGAANIVHLCSTSSSSISFDPEKETRQVMVDKMGIATESEFGQLPHLNITRTTCSEDGVTRFTTNQVTPINDNVESYKFGLKFGSTQSAIKIHGCFTSAILLVSVQGTQTVSYTVNNSPVITKTITGNGLQRVLLSTNGRFQAYEIEIANSQNLVIVGIIFSEPVLSSPIQGLELSETKYLARYLATNKSYNGKVEGKNYPIGAISFDAFSNFVRFFDGTDPWVSSMDFSKLYGRYTRSNSQNSSFEYQIFDQSIEFEYTATPDGGYALVMLNGIIAKSSNFPAVYRGIDPNTGYVDMYSATPERRRVVISSLPFNRYSVNVSVLSPFTKNPLSSDFYININQIFFTNSNGYFGYANQKASSSTFYLGYSNSYDRRKFDSMSTFDELISAVANLFGLTEEPDFTTLDCGNFL